MGQKSIASYRQQWYSYYVIEWSQWESNPTARTVPLAVQTRFSIIRMRGLAPLIAFGPDGTPSRVYRHLARAFYVPALHVIGPTTLRS